MQPDYDGAQYAAEREMAEDAKHMIEALREAMAEGEVTRVTLMPVWEICDDCNGEGSHSRHLGVLDQEFLDDMDEDTWYAYRSGVYDTRCERCSGSGKIKVLDEELLPQDVQAWIENYYEESYRAASLTRMERLYGC